MSVSRCQQEVDSKEFSEWIAFQNLNPGLLERLSILFGMLTYRLVGVWSKNPGPIRNYIIDFEKKHATVNSQEELVVKLKQAQAVLSRPAKKKK
jgi:hypothetical protein